MRGLQRLQLQWGGELRLFTQILPYIPKTVPGYLKLICEQGARQIERCRRGLISWLRKRLSQRAECSWDRLLLFRFDLNRVLVQALRRRMLQSRKVVTLRLCCWPLIGLIIIDWHTWVVTNSRGLRVQVLSGLRQRPTPTISQLTCRGSCRGCRLVRVVWSRWRCAQCIIGGRLYVLGCRRVQTWLLTLGERWIRLVRSSDLNTYKRAQTHRWFDWTSCRRRCE